MSRRRTLWRTALTLASCAALMAACASTDHAPRVAGQEVVKYSDEHNFRAQYDAFEAATKRSAANVADPALLAYVREVGSRVAGDFADELRFYVLEEPAFNAFIAPNGMVVVYSGLLLRLENEAQLAFVLAHEAAHYRQNHGLEALAAAQNANRGILASAMFGTVGLIGMVGAAAGHQAFSRDQEREADAHAVELGRIHGYDAMAGVALWRNDKAESEASSNREKRKLSSGGGLFRSHPVTDERIAFLQSVPAVADPRGMDAAAYRARIRPFLARWLAAEVTQRDAGSTLALLDRLAANGGDLGVIGFARGEVYRARSAEGDEGLALQAYSDAAAHADAPAATWREIGVLSRRAGLAPQARAAFEAYLAAAPAASDRALIEMELMELKGDPA